MPLGRQSLGLVACHVGSLVLFTGEYATFFFNARGGSRGRIQFKNEKLFARSYRRDGFRHFSHHANGSTSGASQA